MEQLLALAIEVISIKVAGKQIKKPIDIPRPGKKGSKVDRNQRREQPEETPASPQAPRLPPAQQQNQQGATKGFTDAGIKHAVSVFRQTARPR